MRCARGHGDRLGGRGHRRRDDALLGDLVARQRGDDVPAGHDEDLVAEALELLGVGGGDDDRDAVADDLAQDPVDLGPGADVDALGGLVGDQDRRVGQQGPGDDDLLLVAAREGSDRRLDATAPSPTATAASRPRPRLGARLDEDRALERPSAERAAFSRTDRLISSPSRVPVGRHVAPPACEQLAAEAAARRPRPSPVNGSRPASARSSSLCPLPTTPASPMISPRARPRRDAANRGRSGPATREARRRRRRDVLRREGGVELAPDDQAEQLVVGDVVDRPTAPQPAVAQHGDPVGELADLGHAGG